MFVSDGLMNFCKTIAPSAYGRWAIDKHWFRTLLHIPLYFILGCVVSFAVQKNGRRVAICSVVAIVDETVKIILPTREFGAVDLVFDAVGFMLGITVVTIISWLLNQGS